MSLGPDTAGPPAGGVQTGGPAHAAAPGNHPQARAARTIPAVGDSTLTVRQPRRTGISSSTTGTGNREGRQAPATHGPLSNGDNLPAHGRLTVSGAPTVHPRPLAQREAPAGAEGFGGASTGAIRTPRAKSTVGAAVVRQDRGECSAPHTGSLNGFTPRPATYTRTRWVPHSAHETPSALPRGRGGLAVPAPTRVAPGTQKRALSPKQEDPPTRPVDRPGTCQVMPSRSPTTRSSRGPSR